MQPQKHQRYVPFLVASVPSPQGRCKAARLPKAACDPFAGQDAAADAHKATPSLGAERVSSAALQTERVVPDMQTRRQSDACWREPPPANVEDELWPTLRHEGPERRQGRPTRVLQVRRADRAGLEA